MRPLEKGLAAVGGPAEAEGGMWGWGGERSVIFMNKLQGTSCYLEKGRLSEIDNLAKTTGS